ncbi:kinesin-like protein [Sporothrix eucalyptigena]|uniref:Kinesin-like protein n=1 Tax=Sporothrix eucalyptigena TaxID=1812306 RepID=A0ABP0D0E4_9PEZI
MSSNTPASFASAAAGQSRGARPGEGDWSRHGRSANGTLTFRRPSAAVVNQQSQTASDASVPALPSLTESSVIRPNLPPFDGSLRYSRDQLLEIFKGMLPNSVDVNNLFVGGWSTTQVNGAPRGWGKSSEGTIPQDPTVCWDANGSIAPIGLQEMTEEEKELFADVNSTLKPQQPKDSQIGGGGGGNNAAGTVNGRKTSISHSTGYGNNNSGNNNTNNNSTPSSISSSRPATRRRETSDTNPFPSGGLTSPLSSRTPREESSWFGGRKNADAKDVQPQTQLTDEPEEEQVGAAPARPSNTATLGRSNTTGSVLGGSSSLWGASGPAPAPAAGAFGSFALPSTTGDKRFGSVRGESRLAHLLPKHDSAADAAAPGTKPTGAGNAVASPIGAASGTSTKDSWRARPRTDAVPFSEEGGQASSASQNLNTFDTPVKAAKGDFGMSGLNIGTSLDEDNAGSPETNPFHSPPAERSGGGNGEGDHLSQAPSSAIGAIGGSAGLDHAAVFGSTRGGYPTANFDGSDRSQTSSVGAKGFSSFGNIAGWGNPLTSNTPDRDRAVFSAAFGNSLFSPGTGELQSPGFGSGVPAGGVFGPSGAGGTGSLRTSTSKLGALFPASMQAQMSANQEQEGGALSDSVPDIRQINPLGAIGRETVGSQARDGDIGGIRPGRGLFDDSVDPTRGGPSSIFTTEQGSQPNILASTSSPLPQHFESGLRPNADTPLNAPRTMVMPDRMRWVYLDPQGQTQGPFTGLEMNDWYKANFFTADLRVRKVEDTEFEPLGQLIRRIGNSREPFLVPQMGVAHGQPSLSGTFTHGDRGTVIPPLVGAFPSYGRTLTAEEQNNLERRKQEEQYVLARQREMLAVQHHAPFNAARPGAVGVPGGALHHHSSAHSLQSQPSFGSMTSPLATGPPPIPGHLGATSGFFDHSGLPAVSQPLATGSTEFLRDEYTLQDRQMLSGILPNLGAPGNFQSQQSSSGISSDLGSLGHLPSIDQLQKDPQGFSERLKEFKQYREQFDASEAGNFQSEAPAIPASALGKQQQVAADIVDEVASEHQAQSRGKLTSEEDISEPVASLSLTQQVQKTQAEAAAAKRRGTQADEPAETSQTDLPMPFPPPQGAASSTPLAAPTAQRTRSTLPDQYATSQSRSETPESGAVGSTQPPPLAPWARDPGSESHRGPSLKEIQEAEAKKAAKAEEIAAAARKIAAEQEAALQREREKVAAALAPGLPTSSTWGNGMPTASGAAIAAAPASPWAKTANAKPSVPGSAVGGIAHGAADKKKTLADIQREEEARKQKTRELASQSPLASSPFVGKRYADLASRGQPPAAPSPVATSASPVAVAAGWATVGAGGKVKTPTAPPATRNVSAAAPAVKTPVALAGARSTSRQLSGTSGKVEGGVAMDEFNKWLHREVSRGIADDIDVNMFVDTLLQLPLDQSIISEAVYGSSKTMDGRHFAEEFIRRKKLAERGIVEKQATDVKTGGGWSEVAKKGGSSTVQKEESMPAGFKVVPSRKKGKK